LPLPWILSSDEMLSISSLPRPSMPLVGAGA
jgi:hypothetical protein